MKLLQKIILSSLITALTVAAYATPTFTVKMANLSPIKLNQALRINYIMVRKGIPGHTDITDTVSYPYPSPVNTTLQNMVNQSKADIQQEMPIKIMASGLSHSVGKDFHFVLSITDADGSEPFRCTTSQQTYNDPDNGNFVLTITGSNVCTLTSNS